MMKKDYIKPETCVILMPAIQPLLAGSLRYVNTGFDGSFSEDEVEDGN